MNDFFEIMDAVLEALEIILAVPILLVCMAVLLILSPFYLPVYVYRKWRKSHDK